MLDSSIPASEDVKTTLLTVLLFLVTLPKRFFVPCTAGSIKSFCTEDCLTLCFLDTTQIFLEIE